MLHVFFILLRGATQNNFTTCHVEVWCFEGVFLGYVRQHSQASKLELRSRRAASPPSSSCLARRSRVSFLCSSCSLRSQWQATFRSEHVSPFCGVIQRVVWATEKGDQQSEVCPAGLFAIFFRWCALSKHPDTYQYKGTGLRKAPGGGRPQGSP